jgi:hypothetical protein
MVCNVPSLPASHNATHSALFEDFCEISTTRRPYVVYALEDVEILEDMRLLLGPNHQAHIRQPYSTPRAYKRGMTGNYMGGRY